MSNHPDSNQRKRNFLGDNQQHRNTPGAFPQAYQSTIPAASNVRGLPAPRAATASNPVPKHVNKRQKISKGGDAETDESDSESDTVQSMPGLLKTRQQPMVGTMNINNLTGGYGGHGGDSENQAGDGGLGQGPIVYTKQMHVENMYGSSSATDLLPWFAPKALFNADTAAGGAARGPCTKETRQELLSRVKQWACDTSDSLPIFWLSGMAGTGKSTVTYTLCEHWRRNNCLGGSFFCSRNDEKARSRSYIIPTLVHQLLYSHKPFAHSLRDVPINVVGPASAQHVEELLVKPWLQSIDSQSSILEQPPLLVVIDALDEIEGNHDGPQLIKQLIQAVSAINPRLCGLKFFVTSRPHPDIKKECSSIDQQAVYQMEEITTEKAFEDVGCFVSAQLPDLHPNWQKAIVTNSSGLFIYAATIVRYLCTHSPPLSRKQQQNRLDKLWKSGVNTRVPDSKHGIDSLYDTITQVLHNNSPEVEISRRVLYAVVTTRRPLTVSDLAPLVVDAGEEADEEAVRNSVDFLFHAVLYISPRDKCIYTFHKSFADYIVDPVRCPGWANTAVSYFRTRTQDCIEIMNKYLHFNMCNLESSFLLDKEVKDLPDRVETTIGPELRYACQHWATQLASVKQDSRKEVQQLSASLLGFYRLKVLFWMETMNLLKLDCQFATNLARIWVLQVPNEEELKNYTAAVQILWASFSRGQCKESTPHLYISSLATDFALTSGVTLTKWRQHFPGIPSIKCKGIFLYRMLMRIEGHSGRVTSVVFSPGGAHIVSGSSDKTVRIWDATTGAEVIRMEGHSDVVNCVAFSPDGVHIVSGSDDKTVRVWDATTGAEVTRMEGHSWWVTSVVFSPDSAHIVSGSYDKTVRIWDATTGAEVTRMEGHRDVVNCVAFSPDGVHIVSGSSDKTVRIWDTITGAEVTGMKGHNGGVTSVVFSPDGAHIVSASGDKTVRIWDVTMCAEVTRMEGHNQLVTSVAFSPNGAHIVSGSQDQTIRIWDTTTGAEVTRMEGPNQLVSSVAFSPDGVHIVSGSSDKTIQIWDATPGAEVIRMEGHSGWVTSVAFSPDGAHIASGSSDETFRIWDATTGAEVTRMEGHTQLVSSMAFSHNSAHIVSGSQDSTVRTWDAKTGAEVTKIEGHRYWVTSVVFSPDSVHIVSGSSDTTVRIWDATTGAEVTRMEGHSDWVTSVASSPDGAHIASGSGDKTVRIWDATTGAEVTTMEGHNQLVTSVAFSPDGVHIASGSGDKTVRIWDVTMGAEVTRMEGHSDWVTSVAFSPNGAHIVSGSSDKTVRIWDATTGAEVTRMEGPNQLVTSVAFSPDGAHIVSGSGDETVRIWDTTTDAEVTRMEGHSSVAFSPDGVHLASGSGNKTVQIWDMATGAEVTRMEGNNRLVTSVVFLPDGAHIVSGSGDKTVRIWDTITGAEVIKMEDGWVMQRGEPKIRFFWYPPELHNTLFFPPCLYLISNKAQTRLELHAHTLGTNWQQIYQSSLTSALEC